jgi:predicted MFS family arabinose efflux permease
LTPHIGSSSRATRMAMAMTAANNLIAALSGQRPPNLVNPKSGNDGHAPGRAARPRRGRSAAYLLSFFHRVAPAAISGDLQSAFAIGGAQLGTLAATYFYVYTVMQIPTGVLSDTLGPRRILFWGGLVAGVGAIVFGLAPSFELAFVGRTLVGLGVSVAFIAMLKLIALGFDERRFASITGLCMLIGNAGVDLAGAPLAWATQVAGWRPVFVVVGVLSLLMAFAARAWVLDTPAGKVDRTAWLTGLLTVMKNRATWPGFFANAGLAGAFFAFAGLWAVPYLTQIHGMSRTEASSHVSIYFIGFAIGSMLWGNVSDRIGRRKPVMLAVSGAHALGWGLWLSGHDAGRLDDLFAMHGDGAGDGRPDIVLGGGQGSQSAAALGHGHQRGQCGRVLRSGDPATGGRLAHGTHLGRSRRRPACASIRRRTGKMDCC